MTFESLANELLLEVFEYFSIQGRSQGGALGACAPPLEKKCLEGSKELKEIFAGQKIFSAGVHPP
jgi:hypothetical protein